MGREKRRGGNGAPSEVTVYFDPDISGYGYGMSIKISRTEVKSYRCDACGNRYAFMQQTYEAEKIGEHRLAVINVCSALEMSLTKAIEGYYADHDIDSQLIFKKYRYLRDLIEFLAETDSQMESPEIHFGRSKVTGILKAMEDKELVKVEGDGRGVKYRR